MVAEEKYIFKAETKKKLVILGVVGVVLFALGVFMAMQSGGHDAHNPEGHAATEFSKNSVASTDAVAAAEGHEEAAAEHHGSALWLKRIYTSLWHNNVFFTGIGIIGLFFIAIQYPA